MPLDIRTGGQEEVIDHLLSSSADMAAFLSTIRRLTCHPSLFGENGSASWLRLLTPGRYGEACRGPNWATDSSTAEGADPSLAGS